MKKIALIGYMGSGKTTIAALLSRAAGLSHIDLDEFISQQHGETIASLFQSKGEIWFRKTEHAVLKQLLEIGGSFVLSTGGGTPCYAGNHKLLNSDGVISVYLKASVGELHRRLVAQGVGGRPLLATLPPQEQQEYIAKHLFDRSYYYMQATHVVATDAKTPEEVVNEIMSLF